MIISVIRFDISITIPADFSSIHLAGIVGSHKDAGGIHINIITNSYATHWIKQSIPTIMQAILKRT
jgi:hypothetical protein